MDDRCTALPFHCIDQFLNHLNRVEPSIQFTVEVESSGISPFLHYCVQITDTPTDIWTSWHTKFAVVKTLHGRTEAISSSGVHKDSEVRHIREALGTNGYSRGVVERHQSSPQG